MDTMGGVLCIDHGIGLIPLAVRVQEYDIIHGEPIIDMARRKNRDLIEFSCRLRRVMEMVGIGCAGGLQKEVEGCG